MYTEIIVNKNDEIQLKLKKIKILIVPWVVTITSIRYSN